MFNRPSFQIITAGTGKEPVGDLVKLSAEYAGLAQTVPEYQGHSPFTAVLLQALHGLTGLPDGRLLASDLGYHMSFTLVADKRIGARQAPKYGTLGRGDGDFLFLPAYKVLNPKLIAPLYLPGEQYAELRQSGCKALQQFISQQEEKDRLPLARSAVTHLGRLLQDQQPGPRLTAARVLADLAEQYARQDAPEFGEVRGRLLALLRDDQQSRELQRDIARALGQLQAFADQELVEALAAHVERREKTWKTYELQLAGQLGIASGQFLLPEEVQASLERIAVPVLAVNPTWKERLAYHDAHRKRLDQLTPAALEPYLQRHQEGKTFLERARKLAGEHDFIGARMTAAKAVGFAGQGRPVRDPVFAAAHPMLLLRNTPDWSESQRLLVEPPYNHLVWSGPVTVHHTGTLTALAYAPDGRTLASASYDQTVRLWDVSTGKATATLQGHADIVTSAVFARDGRTLASAGYDKTVRLWDVDTGQQLAILWGHTSVVDCLAISPDRRTLASGGRDKTIRLWDINTRKEIATLRGHTGFVISLAFAPDGRTLASVSTDRTIRLWDVTTEKETATLPGWDHYAASVAFAPDGRTLAAAGSDIRLWDLETRKQTATLQGGCVTYAPDGRSLAFVRDRMIHVLDVGTGAEIATLRGEYCLAYAPDGLSLACSLDQAIRIWEVGTGKERATLQGHTNVMTSVAYAPDGRSFASAGWDGTVRLWDAGTGQETATLRGHTGWVTCLAYAPDGRTLASGDAAATIRLWDPEMRQETANLPVSGGTRSLAFAPDGRMLASASGKNMVLLWDVSARKQKSSLTWDNAVQCVAFAPDGRTLAAGGANHAIRLWDVQTEKPTATLQGHTDQVSCVVYARDGRTLFSAGRDGTIRFWDAGTNQQRAILRLPSGGMVDALACTADGRTLASSDRTIRLWDVGAEKETATLPGRAASLAFAPDGRVLAGPNRLWEVGAEKATATLRGHSREAQGVAYAPDGQSLACASWDGTVRMWDASLGKEPTRLQGHSGAVTGVAYAPDGRSLASAGADGTIRLWDPGSGKNTRVLSGHALRVNGVAYAPDGRFLASAGSDHTVRLWDLATGNTTATLRGHTEEVTCVAYAPDGRTLASASQDQAIRLWDVNTGKEMARLEGHTFHVNWVAYAPDGRTLASASSDRTVRLWDVGTGKEIAALPSDYVVMCAVFSPDGHSLAAAGSDRSIHLWDVGARRETAILRGHSDEVFCVAFAPDGRSLASASRDRTVRTWEPPTAVPAAAYLPFCDFQKGELHWSPRLADNLYHSQEAVILPVSPSSCLHILRGKLPEAAMNRALFRSYLLADNLDAARLLFERLPAGSDHDAARLALADSLRLGSLWAMDGQALLLAEQRLSQAHELDPAHAQAPYLSARLKLLQLAALPEAQQQAVRQATVNDALTSLEEAVHKGFDGWQPLETDAAWQSLRGEARFQKLLQPLIPVAEWVRRAQLALLKKNPDQAIALCDLALARAPDHFQAHATRGSALVSRGDLEQALIDLKKAISLQPEVALTYYHLACVYSLRSASHPRTAAGDDARNKDVEQALTALEQSFRKGRFDRRRVKADEALKPLQNDPRFQKLMDAP